MSRRQAAHREVATDRVQRLLVLAREAALEERTADAARYGRLAWRVTTRYVLEPSSELKTDVCRACGAYLVPGKTLRVRVTGGKLSRTCLACDHVRRIPFTREQAARRVQPGDG